MIAVGVGRVGTVVTGTVVVPLRLSVIEEVVEEGGKYLAVGAGGLVGVIFRHDSGDDRSVDVGLGDESDVQFQVWI